MYVAPLSPVLEESLKRSEEPCVSILQTADATSLKYILNEKVIEALLRDEQVLVVVGDNEDATLPAKLLSVHKLGHLCLIWNDLESLSEKQLERFQILKSLCPLDLKTGAYDNIRLQRITIKNRIVESLNNLNRSILGDLTLKAIIQKRNGTADLQHAWSPTVKSDPTEINQTLDALNNLENKWDNRFAVWQSLRILEDSCFIEEGAPSKALEAVALLKSTGANLRDKLDMLLATFQKRIQTKIWDEYDRWNELAEQLLDLYYSQEIEQRFALWDEAVQELMSAFKRTDYLKFDDLQISYFDWDQTLDNIDKINSYLAQHQAHINHYTEEFFRRLTPFNTDDPEMMLLVDQVKKFVGDVNESPYLKMSVESDVLLIQVMSERLSLIQESVDNAFLLLSDEPYIQFKKCQIDAQMSDDSLAYVQSHSTHNWADAYLQFIYNGMTREHFSPDLRKLEDRLQKHDQLLLNSKELLLQEIHNRWCKRKDSAIEEIQHYNPDLYHILFENKQTSLSINNIFFNDPSFLKAFYPVLCVAMDDLSTILRNKKTKWDHIIFLNTKDLPTIDLPHKESDVFVATSHHLPVDDIMNQYPVRYFYAAESRPDFTRPFSLLSRSEKYHQALQLASCLLSVIDRYVVFQVRDECCISLLNKSLHQKFMKCLPADDINLLYEGASEIEPLIEALISSGSNVHLLLENHLINDQLSESMEWQIALKDWLTQAGVNIHNICTEDQYVRPEATLHRLARELTFHGSNIDDGEKQESNATI